MSLRMSMAGLMSILAGVMPLASFAGGGGGTDIERDTVGVVRGIGGQGSGFPAFWILRSSNASSCATPTITQFGFGDDGDQVLSVDLDGDGLSTATVFRDVSGAGFFFVRNSNASGSVGATKIPFGAGTDIGIAGNFDPTDVGDEIGVYRPSTNQFFLNNDSGIVSFIFGIPGDIPIVGNWDGSVDGSDEVGLFRPSTGQFLLRSDNLPGAATIVTRIMGTTGDVAIIGDWDGDGTTTIGVYRDAGPSIGGIHFFNNQATGGVGEFFLLFGASGTDRPVTGDWDGRTVDEGGCGV